MKKLIYIVASVLICASISTVFPVVYADEVDTTILTEETAQQEPTLPDDEVLPAIWDPQSEEVKD